MVITAEEFRATLSLWASGVSVVTTRDGEKLVGMTVSSFCSVSLAPPLVLICAANDSETCPAIQRSGFFVVNILTSRQRALSQRFSAPEFEGKRFDGLAFHTGVSGLPVLEETVASLECCVVADTLQGDHRVFFGQVLRAERTEQPPLVFHRGKYRQLAEL